MTQNQNHEKNLPSKNDAAPEGTKLCTAEGTGRPVLPWKGDAGTTFRSLEGSLLWVTSLLPQSQVNISDYSLKP